MAIGHAQRPPRGGRMGMGASRGSFGGGSRTGSSLGSMGGFAKPAPKPSFSPRPMAAPPSPVNINIGSPGRSFGGGGGGLMGVIVGNAVSAGVGIASAAIVNKMHENSQLKLAEQQAAKQAEMAQYQAEHEAALIRQHAEIEKLKIQQEEVKRDAAQNKRYYANCPYCLGVNNGDKFCRYCGSSLAYYEDDDENKAEPKNGNINPAGQNA